MAQPTPGPSQPPATPAQGSVDIKRRAEAEADVSRRIKHQRAPLPPPHVLATLVPDSPAFNDLMKVEQKLDWTLLRKKAEINDALGRPVRVKRSLRVFISNTAHHQTWQDDASGRSQEQNGDSTQNVDVNTGKGIPGWVLRVEGRLLDSGNVRLDKTKRKFSSFLRSVVVEFDNREPPTYPEGNIVEWHPQTLQAPLDGFEVLRRGDTNVNCRIILHVAHFPERFRVLAPLDGLISMKEGTRADVMAAVWKFIKVVGAQDKEDGTIIRPVGGMEKIMPPGQEGVAFHQLPELVTRFLNHPQPVVIPYTIRVDQDFNLHDKCFDIPIEIDDPLKSKMAYIVQSFEGEEGREIVKLEDKVGELAYFARDLKQKRDFLEAFAAEPYTFIQNWLAAQARDLDQMLGFQIGVAGPNGGSVREEDLRRSDVFQMPWVDEAITVHESTRMEAERRGR
ncbi:putative chromatin remodeling-related protein [Naematelia encephala]|uniref:Putative chromatin remodeling-related protein n=1 Tax=Naematelia encephala TaxID=71784 RepID=A0A1Y2BJ01_9TREE|nr:putative chromatin remodeling-related protein [Naematelia encephala]